MPLHRVAPAGLSRREALAAGDLQRRFVALEGVATTSEREFVGYGSVFEVLDSYGTVIAPGAFSRTLREWRGRGSLPDFYLQHDYSLVVGKFLEMAEDERGLKLRGRFVQSSIGDHALALMQEDIATGLSIGFFTRSFEMRDQVMRITDVDLMEVSQVTRPANPEAGITGRAQLIHADLTVRQIEALLRDLGAPRDAAKRMASGWRSKAERDAGEELGLRDAAPQPSLAELLRAAAITLKH